MSKIYLYGFFYLILFGSSCKKSLLKAKNTIPLDGFIAYFPFDGNTDDASKKRNNGKPTNISYTTENKVI